MDDDFEPLVADAFCVNFPSGGSRIVSTVIVLREGLGTSITPMRRKPHKSGGLRCTRCNAAFVQAGEAWVHPFSESGCPAACVGVVLSQSHKPGGSE